MNLYLAASFSRQAEMRAVRSRLQSEGFGITSRWPDETPCPEGQNRVAFLTDMVDVDLFDLDLADAIVRFTDQSAILGKVEPVPASLATGARHFETGYAYARGKKVIIVGGCQNVFDYLRGFVHVADVEELVSYLKGQS
jgi:nucleoside 2-deoxyribosyltransferase